MIIGTVELVHALFWGFAGESEWQKSFAQYVTYSTAFILITGFKLDRRTLITVAPWIMKLSVFLGGIGILQFILAEIGIPAYLPLDWRVKAYDPFSELRAGGFAPACGLAREPYLYASGLAILLACILFLENADSIHNRRLRRVAIIALLGGVLVSFSMTGIAISVTLLAMQSILTRDSKHLLIGLIVGMIVLGTIGTSIIGPIQTRMKRILAGSDNSSQVRVVASTRLLFAPLSGLETSLLGTGLGMERRELEMYLRVYRDVSLRPLSINDVKIHSILPVIRFLQGWLGVVLYVIMAWTVARPLTTRLRIYLPLFVFFALYHFSTGYYLMPEFWSLLALLSVLRRASLE